MTNPPRLPEQAHSSLEDSSYEILGESSYEASDDEANTESLASTNGDGHTPDDVSSISDGDEFEDQDYMDDASQQLPPPASYPVHQAAEAHETTPDNSMIASAADTQMGEDSYLVLEETLSNTHGSVEACGVVTKFDKSRGLPDILQRYGFPELRHTVKMSLSEGPLPIPRSYRLLYVGHFPDWAVEEANDRIGAALDAAPSSSRFNIVQGPAYPGSASSSKVQLERSGPELVVDHCVSPEIVQEYDRPSRVQITLDDGTQLTFGPGKNVRIQGEASANCLPDLVIFCYSTMKSDMESADEAEIFHLTRGAFDRHGIPSLDISMVRPYGNPPQAFAFDNDSLRLCVEGRHRHCNKYEIRETLPIDIYNFCLIEPAQLNRHLAFISRRSIRSKPSHQQGLRSSWNIASVLTGFTKSPARSRAAVYWAQPNFLKIAIGLMAMATLYLAGFTTLPLYSPNMEQAAVESASPATFLVQPLGINQVTPSLTSATSTMSVPTKSVPKDLTVVAPLEKHIKSQHDFDQASKEARIKAFDIEVIGHHQFALRPSIRFPNEKRKPPLHIQVTRDLNRVAVRVHRTPNDTYIVDVEDEYLLGTFNVSIVARRKPFLQQSFEIKMGLPRSRIAGLIEGVKHDVAMAQLNLRNLSNQLSKNIQASVILFEDGAAAAFGQTRHWRQHVQDSTQSVTDHLQEASRKAVRQLCVGSKVTKEVSKAVQKNWHLYASHASGIVQVVQDVRLPSIWEQTRSFRTAPSVLKARKNALKLHKALTKKDAKKIHKFKDAVRSKCKKWGKKCKQSKGNGR